MFLIFIAGLPSAIDLNILGKMDAIFGGILLILGGLLLSILFGWVIPKSFESDLNNSRTNIKIITPLKFMLRWISPPVIAFGLIISLIDLIN